MRNRRYVSNRLSRLDIPANWNSKVALGEGSHAIVQGLQKLPVFNGQVALLQGWDADAGRYSILLAAPSVPDSFQHAKVKPENLRAVVV